jgi:hypothetical protein
MLPKDGMAESAVPLDPASDEKHGDEGVGDSSFVRAAWLFED